MGYHTNLKYDEAYEEVVARLSEAFLRDAHLTEKSRELYKSNRTLWEKIRDGLTKVVADIKKYFGGVSPQSELGRLGEKMVKENQTILDKFVSVLNTASENAAYTEKATNNGGVMYDLRGYSEQQLKNWKSSAVLRNFRKAANFFQK